MFNKNKNQGFTHQTFLKKKLGGFTLIELLVVIAIIGVLSGIVIIHVGDAIERARIARGQAFRHSIHMTIGQHMVGWWGFDGNVLDLSGWRNDGTMNNFPANPWEPGVIRNALNFDGANTFVEIPHHELQNTVFGTSVRFTLEGWAHPRAWANWTSIINKANDGCWSHTTNGMWASDQNGFACAMGIGPGACNPPGSVIMVANRPSLNQWHHIVCTADGTNLIMFVNGTEVGRTAIAGLTHPRSTNTAPITIGRRCVGCGPSFNGFIDEVRAYSAAMPTSYIQKRYVQGIKDLYANGGLTQEEKQERLAVLRNSEYLVIDLDAALAGNIDFSQYAEYLVLEK